jgi:hypothetical protein
MFPCLLEVLATFARKLRDCKQLFGGQAALAGNPPLWLRALSCVDLLCFHVTNYNPPRENIQVIFLDLIPAVEV